jgi:hypothetical protein
MVVFDGELGLRCDGFLIEFDTLVRIDLKGRTLSNDQPLQGFGQGGNADLVQLGRNLPSSRLFSGEVERCDLSFATRTVCNVAAIHQDAFCIIPPMEGSDCGCESGTFCKY